MIDQLDGRFGDQRFAILSGRAKYSTEQRRQNFFARQRNSAANLLRDARMPRQKLVPSLVRDNGCEREIIGFVISFKSLRVNGE